MSAYNNKLPLYKVAKFRRIRQIVTSIARHEKINISLYNLEKIYCYRSHGRDLNGRRVSSNVVDDRFFLVSNNLYEVYEIPNKSNTKPYTGQYLVLFYNTDFDYYILARMNHKVNISNGTLNESANFYAYGKYDILSCNAQGVKFYKSEAGHKLNYGFGSKDKETPNRFDSLGVRKRNGYHIEEKEILGINHKRFTSGNNLNINFNQKNNRRTKK